MAFADDDLRSFEQALSALLDAVKEDPASTGDLIEEAFAELSSSDLPLDEVSRRARRIADGLPDEHAVRRASATAARRSSPAVRAAVVGSLPAGMQRIVYETGVSEVGVEAGFEGAKSAAPERGQPERTGRGADRSADARTVWLLGDRDRFESTARLLESYDFHPIHLQDPDHLTLVEEEGCCGVAIDDSWWRQLEDPRDVVAFMQRQLDRSNVPVYRIDTSGLGESEGSAFEELLITYGSGTRSRVQTGPGAALGTTDITRLEDTAELLDLATSSVVRLEGLSDVESRLIAAAIAMFGEEIRGYEKSVGELVMVPVTDGTSGARVYRIRNADAEAVYIAKLDEVAKLRAEMALARAAAPQDDDVVMEVYSLGGRAVLLQRLVPNLDDPWKGAPSLRERLHDRAAFERGREGLVEPLVEDLEVGIDRLVAAVERVRARPAEGLACNCWTGTEPLAALASHGVRWEIDSGERVFNPAELLPQVSAKLRESETERVVHGDLHAGNVLMLDDRTPKLIDFASAGSGHPCFDLVRLSSFLAYSSIRPVCEESRLREFFQRVHVDGADRAAVEAEFPDLLASNLSRLAGKTLVDCRLGALAQDGGARGETDYLAMVYLVAAQSLTMDHFQSVVVRATLGAIDPPLRRELSAVESEAL